MNEKELLKSLMERGIISTDDISQLEMEKKKEEVLKVHKQKIWVGNDNRWQTHIYVDGKRKLVAKKEEKALYEALYSHYYGAKKKSYKNCTLKDLYGEWLEYKAQTANRETTVYRLDVEYKRYYMNEPLTEKLLNKPMTDITVDELEVWATQIIKKYDMTAKMWNNCSTIWRQTYKYLIKKKATTENPMLLLDLKPGLCRVPDKPAAETQIFFDGERKAIIDRCLELAEEKHDVGYLAIVLCFLTGVRIGECLALTYADFDAVAHTMLINKMLAASQSRNDDGTWTTRTYHVIDEVKKNSGGRVVAVHDDVFAVLEKIKNIQRMNGNLSMALFDTITPHNVCCKLYRLCDKLDIIKRSPHKERKTYISKLINDGFDMDFVRKQAGHKKIQTTLDAYVFSTTENEAQIEKLAESLAL